MARKLANGLTEQQQTFCDVYRCDPEKNATKAYRTAYPRCKSDATAAVEASKLLRNPKIEAYLAKKAEKIAKKYDLTAELAARSIVQELTFDPAKLYREDGTLKDVTELDEDTRMALTSVEFEHIGDKDSPATVRKIKWASRHQAREQLMKHLGMFERDNAQKTPTVIIKDFTGVNGDD